MNYFQHLYLALISLLFIAIVSLEIEVRDWCIGDSVTYNVSYSEAPPDLPDFPDCLGTTTTATTTGATTTGPTMMGSTVTGPTATAPLATSPMSTGTTATGTTATGTTATGTTATGTTATGTTAKGPTAKGPTATSPTATSPTATSPTATSPTATSPTATSPTAAGPMSTGTTATSTPIPGEGRVTMVTTSTTGIISQNVIRGITIWMGVVSAVIHTLVILYQCYVWIKIAEQHNKVHPNAQDRTDNEDQENSSANESLSQPAKERKQPASSFFQGILQGVLSHGAYRVQVRLIVIVSLVAVFVLILVGFMLAGTANHLISLVIFAVCTSFSLAYCMLLMVTKMTYKKPTKQHDEDICLENCPEKTRPSVDEGLKPMNEEDTIENKLPIEKERPSSVSSSKGGRVITTPHGDGPKESGDERSRKISSGDQAGDTILLVSIDTDTMYRRPRKKKKKRASRPSIELGELRLPGTRSSYGHIYDEHTT